MIDLEEVVDTGRNMIRCWQFYDAPLILQNLSTHGGDEELIFVVPVDIDETLDANTTIYDILYCGYVKPCRKVIGTHVVYITAH
jgi:hypothetical protein